jgi:CHAD domain-containing protein
VNPERGPIHAGAAGVVCVTAMDASILERPAPAGARLLALALLDEAAAAAKRWRRDDPEGLHDFRVAIRRLRTCLGVHRAWLGGAVRRKDRRRLRKLARITGAARDRDVLAATVEHEDAPRDLVERLAQRAASRREAARRLVRAKLPKARRALRRRLARAAEGGPPFREAVRQAVAALGAELEEALARADDDASLHRARIAAKRLRYTLEALGGEGRAALEALAALQDLLGRVRDLGFAVARLAREARDDPRCAPKRAQAEARRDALIATLRAQWRDGPAWAALRRDLAFPTPTP